MAHIPLMEKPHYPYIMLQLVYPPVMFQICIICQVMPFQYLKAYMFIPLSCDVPIHI